MSVDRKSILDDGAVGIEVETQSFIIDREAAVPFCSQDVNEIVLLKNRKFLDGRAWQVDKLMAIPVAKFVSAEQVIDHSAADRATMFDDSGMLPACRIKGNLLRAVLVDPGEEG